MTRMANQWEKKGRKKRRVERREERAESTSFMGRENRSQGYVEMVRVLFFVVCVGRRLRDTSCERVKVWEQRRVEGMQRENENEKEKEKERDSSGLQKSKRRTLGVSCSQPASYILIIIVPESLDVNARMHTPTSTNP